MIKKQYASDTMRTTGKSKLAIRLTQIFEKPVHLVVIIIAVIFLTEALIMLILSILPPLETYKIMFLDSLLLILILLPMLHVFVLKPLQLHITERKQAEKLILEIENRERRRVGQDLHDSLGQLLTGIAFKMRSLGRKLENVYTEEAEDAAEISVLVDDAKKEVSQMSRGLLSIDVEGKGLFTLLESLSLYARNTFGILCDFRYDDSIVMKDERVIIQLYRIAQEAVTNAVKHAKAGNIEIDLLKTRNNISLIVRDDGTGLFPMRNMSGMGLKIMQHRASMINAVLTIENQVKGGTSVVCSLSGRSNKEKD